MPQFVYVVITSRNLHIVLENILIVWFKCRLGGGGEGVGGNNFFKFSLQHYGVFHRGCILFNQQSHSQVKGSNSQLTEIKSQLLPFVYNLSCSYPRMRKRIPFFISEFCNNPVVHVKMYCCFLFCGMSIELSINCEDKSM